MKSASQLVNPKKYKQAYESGKNDGANGKPYKNPYSRDTEIEGWFGYEDGYKEHFAYYELKEITD